MLHVTTKQHFKDFLVSQGILAAYTENVLKQNRLRHYLRYNTKPIVLQNFLISLKARNLIVGAFSWVDTEEGVQFWSKHHHLWLQKLEELSTNEH